jgi:hypothetical protein
MLNSKNLKSTAPIATIGDVMPPELKGRNEREYEMTEPATIRRLYNRLKNYNDVGKLIGMSGTNVNKILNQNKTVATNELAAL